MSATNLAQLPDDATLLGNHRLIVVNPYKPLDLLNDITLQAYANHGYKDLLAATDGFAAPEPHIYELATRVYFIMRRRGKDQAIVRHILNELLLLSTHTRREDKVRQQIVSVNTIVDAFTTAATTDNIVASRIGKFHSLQFNERGRIVGSHLAVYLLDKFRVTRQQTAANYHVFHQLLTGTSTDEKVAFHIHHTADHFAYLKHTFGTAMARDEFAFGDLKAALKTCGFKTKTVAHMCQLLAAILHLGNVQFVDANKHHFGGGTSSSFSSQESCRVKNKDTLSLVAAALGVATAKLENTLTHKCGDSD